MFSALPYPEWESIPLQFRTVLSPMPNFATDRSHNKETKGINVEGGKGICT